MSLFFYLLFFLSFIIGNLEATRNHHGKKHPSAIVVGTVYYDTCFQDDFSNASHIISGVSVAVECKYGTSKQGFRQEVKTDEHGEFKVDLPFTVSKHVKIIKRCWVKLINSSEPYCAVASSTSSSSLRLKEKKQGVHIFSAGFFTFKPLKQPSLCNQKPSLKNSVTLNSRETLLPPNNNPLIFPPPIQDPTMPVFQPIPQLPRLPALPQLPPLPSLPRLPFLPPMPGKIPDKKPEEQAQSDFVFPPLPPNPFLPPPTLPPNPLQPPPLFPPNPLQPPPSPIFPPNPLLPPPSPLIPLPTVPGLNPPPPPPTFPIPLPPLPPGFPGIPPASSPSSPENLSP